MTTDIPSISENNTSIWTHADAGNWDEVFVRIGAREISSHVDMEKLYDQMYDFPSNGVDAYNPQKNYGELNEGFVSALSSMLKGWIAEYAQLSNLPDDLINMIEGFQLPLIAQEQEADHAYWINVVDNLPSLKIDLAAYHLTSTLANLDSPSMLQHLFDSKKMLNETYVWSTNSCLVSDMASAQSIECFRHICATPAILDMWEQNDDCGSLPHQILQMSLAVFAHDQRRASPPTLQAFPIIVECADHSSLSMQNHHGAIDWEASLCSVSYAVAGHLPSGSLIDECMQGQSLFRVVNHWMRSVCFDTAGSETADEMVSAIQNIVPWWSKLTVPDRYHSLSLMMGEVERGTWFRAKDHKINALLPAFEHLLSHFDANELRQLASGNTPFDLLVQHTSTWQRVQMLDELSPQMLAAPSKSSKI